MLPILLYPIIPLITKSNKYIQKLQSLQNKALRFVYNQRYPYSLSIEKLHELAILKPVNIILHERTQKKWEITNELPTRRTIFN